MRGECRAAVQVSTQRPIQCRKVQPKREGLQDGSRLRRTLDRGRVTIGITIVHEFPHLTRCSPQHPGCRAQEAPAVLVQPQLRAPKVPVQEGAEALGAPAVQVQGVHSAAGARCFAVQCTHVGEGVPAVLRCTARDAIHTVSHI